MKRMSVSADGQGACDLGNRTARSYASNQVAALVPGSHAEAMLVLVAASRAPP